MAMQPYHNLEDLLDLFWGVDTRLYPLRRMVTVPNNLHFHWDISENDTHYVVKADLPGLDKDHINVELQDGLLTVSGEKKEERSESNDKYHYTERRYGNFKRSTRLPKNINEDNIKASYKDGVLTLYVEKVELHKNKKQISIEY